MDLWDDGLSVGVLMIDGRGAWVLIVVRWGGGVLVDERGDCGEGVRV